MSLAWNIRKHVEDTLPEDSSKRVSVEYNLLSWRELYDKSIITADRYSSGAGEWVIQSSKKFYQVTVLTRPFYVIPQRLCLSFDCFTKEETINSEGGQFISSDQPIDQVALEFSVLLSVFAREPIIPLGIRRVSDKPTHAEPHEIYPRGIDRNAPPPPFGINSPEFITILKGFSTATDSQSQAILGAAKFYHAGLSLLTFDRSVAYTSLVSAIECLAGFYYKNLEFKFEDVQKFQKANKVLHKIEALEDGADLVADLKSELLRTERFLSKKFVNFLVKFTPKDSWTIRDEIYDYENVFPALNQSNFEKCLKLIYNHRSKYLHGGQPFPIYVEFGIRRTHPSDMMGELFGIRGKDKYLPPFSWFERLVHLAIIEFMKCKLSPCLQQEHIARLKEKERLIDLISTLPENVQESLRRLTIWTRKFLPYAVINPHSPNKVWADCDETVHLLKDYGLIGGEGKGLEGSSWLLNREVGEIVGEFIFGRSNNPFRGNELLLPKDWDQLSQQISTESEDKDNSS